MVGPEKHAYIQPHRAARWVVCPASVRAEAEAPLPPTEDDDRAAQEGVAAYYFAADMLQRHAGVVVGDKAPNGVVADDEMVDAAETFIEHIRGMLVVGRDLHIEEYVDIPRVHEDNGGTPDLWWTSPTGTGCILYVVDFKYGYRYVDAFLNWQMLDYFAGILGHEEVARYKPEDIEVVFCIFQPRSYHWDGTFRTWRTRASDIMTYVEELKMAAEDGVKPNPIARPNPECYDCKGRHTCNAAHVATGRAKDLALAYSPLKLPSVALGVELHDLKRLRKLMDARISGLEQDAEARLRKGDSVPHFGMEPGESREKWLLPDDVIIATAESFGVKAAKDLTAKTPRQVRKAFKDAGKPESTLDGFYERPPSAMKMVEIDANHVKKAFAR